jgi:hypothetical protein
MAEVQAKPIIEVGELCARSVAQLAPVWYEKIASSTTGLNFLLVRADEVIE